MANINLHQALTSQQQASINYKDLDCMVNWLQQFTLGEDHLFGCNFIFRHGMPGKGPTGEGGYEVWGDMGLHIRPTPKPDKYAMRYRYPEIEGHQIKFGSLIEIVAPCTNYYHRDFINLEDPYRIIRQHLAALTRTLPNYHQYLVYKIFVGTETAKENGYIKEWFQTYIEPTDGDTNGYRFMLHGRACQVNYEDVVNPPDKKENTLKKRLEDMNKALRADARKIEVDVEKNAKIKTNGPQGNLTEGSKKTFALFDEVRREARKIMKTGTFETKYKHNSKSFEGFMPRVREAGRLFFIMNRSAWEDYLDERRMTEPTSGLDTDTSTLPAKLILTDLVDRDEAFLIPDGLIQLWFLPQLTRYGVYDYQQFGERTRDFAYEFGHSLDLVDFYPSMYFKLKK